MRTATHTFALLALSPAAYAEISEKLHAAGYGHAFQRVQHDGGAEVDAIDMHGIAVYAAAEEPPAPTAPHYHSEPGCVVGILATTRQALIDHVGAYYTRMPLAEGEPALRVMLPCGAVREYRTLDDIPTQPDPCGCGKLGMPHWFVFYGASPGARPEVVSTSGVVARAAAPDNEHQAAPVFEWVEVTSRNIARAAWADNRLRVQFHSGATFEYQHVTRSWFDAFLGAESKGRFFNEVRLNPTAYPWTRIEA